MRDVPVGVDEEESAAEQPERWLGAVDEGPVGRGCESGLGLRVFVAHEPGGEVWTPLQLVAAGCASMIASRCEAGDPQISSTSAGRSVIHCRSGS